MRLPQKLAAAVTAAALGSSALVGITATASYAALVDRPLINEFLTDEDGADTYEFVEILLPDGYDASDLHIIGIEGDNNSTQGRIKHVYSLANTTFDADGRGVYRTPTNGLENGSYSVALVKGAAPSQNQVVDADKDGILDAGLGFEVLDAAGVSDGGNGDLTYGAGFAATDFPDYQNASGRGTPKLGGLARLTDGSDTWVPLSYNGAGLPGNTNDPLPGSYPATPGAANPGGTGTYVAPEPDPDPTDTDTTITDPDPAGPASVCEADFTLISQVQGSGDTTPLNGQQVTIQGVVVGDFFNASGGSNGFWVQEEETDYDGNPATSEAIFVHNPRAEAPAYGTVVTVTGTAAEYYNQTQLGSATITECGTAELPTAQEITFPIQDDYEHLEGMLVNIPEAVVLEYYQFGRYGEVVVGPERQFTPTAIHAPDTPEAEQLRQDNLANQITIDDRNSIQNYHPVQHLNGQAFTVDNIFRGGDTFRNITGVMDWRNNTWKIQRTQPAEYENTNPRETEVPEVGGDVQVAAFNVLNYFTTMGSRGARNQEEFTRQKDKLATAIAKIDADVIGLMEIENNNDVALNDLVEAVNAKISETGGTRQYTALETGKLGTDQITTALMYDAETVNTVGSHKVLDSSVDSRFDTNRHRPALAQTFTVAGQEDSNLGEFTVITNHLKSKGSECGSEAGSNTDLVGNCNAERVAAAEALVDWAQTQNLPKPIVMGDLNFYDHEEPMTKFEAGNYVDLKKEFEGEQAYSYVFDGQLGYLDYALAHESVLPFVTGAASWHTNSDEASVLSYETRYNTDPAQSEIYEANEFRSSDHDPVVFGLALGHPDTRVVINEVESSGDGDDWVELYNTGTEAIDISGWSLIDNDPTHDPLIFGEGTVIEAGGYLSFATNAADADYFGLGGDDSVILTDKFGNEIDRTSWGSHATDTWGRYPDGTGEFTQTAATRDAANEPVLETRVVINEVESSGDGDDWVELYNTGDEAIDISGWSLIDNDPTHDPLVVPAGTVIDAGGYLSFATNAADANYFGLGGNDSVTLSDQYGRQVDITAWSGHATDTWGRFPDGTGEFTQTAATRDAVNAEYVEQTEEPTQDPTVPEDQLPEVETRVVINEVESNGDNRGDWVELYNTDPNNAVDISGWTLIDGDPTHNPIVVPEGTSIESGGYYLVHTDQPIDHFGLGSNDSVTLSDQYGRQVDTTTWSGHAPQTWGRIPNGTGEFTQTGESTYGAPNKSAEDVAADINSRPWPLPLTEAGVQNAVAANAFGEDLSGVDFDAEGVAYVVNNGTGQLSLLERAADNTYTEVARYQLRYPDGTGTPDAEGVTVGADGVVYVATERNNDDSGVSRPSVLAFTLPTERSLEGVELTATTEWNLTEHIATQIGANSGLEAIEWLPNVHGGTYAVGVEGTGQVLIVRLNADGSSELVDTYASEFQGVMALDYQEVGKQLLILCDEVCEGRSQSVTFNENDQIVPAETNAEGIVLNDRPEGLGNFANEGFATHQVIEQCTNAAEPRVTTYLLWADDAATEGVALRSASSVTGPADCEPFAENAAPVLTIPANENGGTAKTVLGNLTNAGDSLLLTGELPELVVTDGAANSKGWTLSGQASDLRSGVNNTLAAGHLGWAPKLLEEAEGVTVGAPVANLLTGGSGLATSQQLAAANGPTASPVRVSADLNLNVPVTTQTGTYEGAITVSLFPVD